MDNRERRARLALRHGLSPSTRTAGPVEAACAVVGLHGTDPASVFLAVWARTSGVTPAAIERVLYDERALIRILGMRRTMFVVPIDLAAVIHHSSTGAIAVTERRKLIGFIERVELAVDPAAWLRETEEVAYDALVARGTATAAELAADEPRLGQHIVLGAEPYQVRQPICSRVLFMLAADGRIARHRPRGTWISGLYSWAPIGAWMPGGMGLRDPAEARVELVRSWLTSFGPGTLADLKWWTGWTLRDLRPALAQVDTVEVDLDGTPGLVLADDAESVAPAAPWAALLPGLDPTVMGWIGRDWYLGAHAKVLFDKTGNSGPTVWWDGRIVGGWAQRKDGEVAVRLLEDVPVEGVQAIDDRVERLREWLGPARVTPRFRTPLERELAG
ncbi:MAG: winged helix DNA-binding domain-containing protein [Actinomycetota bacterium]|nr:winged helix DNA-binding domain-containing protein [Actinomycetota bacterium]